MCPFIKSFHLPVFLIALLLGACSSPEQSAKKHLDKAYEYLNAHDNKKAIVEFKNVLQIQANSVPAIYGMALAFQSISDWDRVLQFCTRVIELDPKHIGANIKLASIYMAANQMDKALERLEVLEKLVPDNADYLAAKSSFLYKAGDAKAAVEYAKRALSIDPKNSQAVIILSVEALSRESFDEALNIVNTGIHNDPKNIQLKLIRIETLEKSHDLDGAEQYLIELTKNYPDDLDFLKGLAGIYNKQGKVDKVEAVLKVLIKKEPDANNAIYDLVNYVRLTKGDDASLVLLDNFIKDDPKKVELQFFKAFYLNKLNRGNDASTVLKDIASHSNDVENTNKAKAILASSAYDSGSNAYADKLVSEILAKDPRNQAALLLKANRALLSKNFKDAISDLRLIVKDSPTYAPALALLAQAHEFSGEIALSEKYYKRAYDSAGNESKYSLLFVDYLTRNKQYDQAQKMIEPIVSTSPKDPEVLRYQVAIRMAKGDLNGAEALAKNIQSVDSKAGNNLLGTIYMKEGNYNEGVSAFQKNYQDTPNDFQALSALIKSLVNADRKAEAQKMLQQVVTSNPGSLKPKLLLAKLLIHLHDKNAAITIYREVLQSHPNQIEGYEQLGELLSDTGRLSEAEEVLSEGIRNVKQASDLSYLLATTYQRKGEYDKAINLYADLLQKHPDSVVAKNNYISLVTDYKADPALLNNAYLLSKDLSILTSPFVQDTVGWIAFKVGKYEDAKKSLLAASEGAPNVALFAYHLGMCQAVLSEKQNAISSLQKALKIKSNNQEIPVDAINKKIQELSSSAGSL